MPSGSDGDYLAYVQARLPAWRRAASLLCGDLHQADDLVQELLTKLYAKWTKAVKADNLDAYAQTMLVRVFVDDRRRGWWKVRLSGGPPDPAPERGGDPAERETLRAALKRLPPRQQAVLVLRFLCDQPVNEVARILGCSDGTVKSQTSHGLNRLRELLGVDAADRIVARNGSEGAIR